MVDATPAAVVNGARLSVDKVNVGLEVLTVPLTSRYCGVAPLPMWLIEPLIRPGGALLARRTVMACERLPSTDGFKVISPAKAEPPALISKY